MDCGLVLIGVSNKFGLIETGHGSNHEGMVLSCVQFVVLPTFINVKHWVFRWANNVLVSAWIALLWRFVLRLFLCLFLQHECRCRHVSFGGSCIDCKVGKYLV